MDIYGKGFMYDRCTRFHLFSEATITNFQFVHEFQDRRKELELLDDCLGEALTKRAVPVTIALSAATYLAIREGFLKVI